MLQWPSVLLTVGVTVAFVCLTCQLHQPWLTKERNSYEGERSNCCASHACMHVWDFHFSILKPLHNQCICQKQLCALAKLCRFESPERESRVRKQAQVKVQKHHTVSYNVHVFVYTCVDFIIDSLLNPWSSYVELLSTHWTFWSETGFGLLMGLTGKTHQSKNNFHLAGICESPLCSWTSSPGPCQGLMGSRLSSKSLSLSWVQIEKTISNCQVIGYGPTINWRFILRIQKNTRKKKDSINIHPMIRVTTHQWLYHPNF